MMHCRSPRKSRPPASSTGDSSGSLPSVSLREPATHYFDPPDAKMPLQFLANERDSESRGDSRLDVLAQEAELEGGYLKYCSSDEDKSASIAASLKESTKLQDELEKEGNVYLPVANFASKMYFNLADLSKLNNMYRISLESFNRLFEKTLQRAPYKGKEVP